MKLFVFDPEPVRASIRIRFLAIQQFFRDAPDTGTVFAGYPADRTSG
jgi:hypothetical protein